MKWIAELIEDGKVKSDYVLLKLALST